jgi:hypothetical protein
LKAYFPTVTASDSATVDKYASQAETMLDTIPHSILRKLWEASEYRTGDEEVMMANDTEYYMYREILAAAKRGLVVFSVATRYNTNFPGKHEYPNDEGYYTVTREKDGSFTVLNAPKDNPSAYHHSLPDYPAETLTTPCSYTEDGVYCELIHAIKVAPYAWACLYKYFPCADSVEIVPIDDNDLNIIANRMLRSFVAYSHKKMMTDSGDLAVKEAVSLYISAYKLMTQTPSEYNFLVRAARKAYDVVVHERDAALELKAREMEVNLPKVDSAWGLTLCPIYPAAL